MAPLHFQLLENTKYKAGDSPLEKEVKLAVNTDLAKRYNREQEKKTLHLASALDSRFKDLPFLSEEKRVEIFSQVAAEAVALEEKRKEQDCMGNNTADETVLLEEEDVAPPAPKKNTSLLQNLLGQTFNRSQTPEPKSVQTRAAEEVAKYQSVLAISLSEDPLCCVSAERAFSTAGDIVTAQRSTITPEHVDQLLLRICHYQTRTSAVTTQTRTSAVTTQTRTSVMRDAPATSARNQPPFDLHHLKLQRLTCTT
ncbi:hypothetical protein WMY93_009159 [Mugilogobius chulae]|uniref:HAT C-terminal dimerisation domain-containing protein n=1 Tax=Mugilogobius chulae TaxID=88201 RepID=A0AAW0PFW2_9GOBI